MVMFGGPFGGPFSGFGRRAPGPRIMPGFWLPHPDSPGSGTISQEDQGSNNTEESSWARFWRYVGSTIDELTR